MNRSDFRVLLIILMLTIVLTASCGGGGSGDSGNGNAPIPPSGISATEGHYMDKIEISWDAVEGAEYYVIYKSIDNINQFRVIASRIYGLSFTDDKITPNRIYYYRVAAGRGDSWSLPGNDVRGFAHSGRPMTPDNITATSSLIGEIRVSWSTVPQADYYRLLRSTSPGGTYDVIASDLTENEYTDRDSTLIKDKNYFYTVIAVSNSEGEGDPGEAVTGIALDDLPVAPGNFTVSDGIFSNKVVLEWDTVLHAVTYSVFRFDSSETTEGVRIGTGIIPDSTGKCFFEDITSAADATYWYVVCGVSSGGDGEFSAKTAGSASSGGISQATAPVNVSATDGNFSSVTITWDPVDGAHEYKIYRSEEISSNYIPIGTVSGNFYIDSDTLLTDDLTCLKKYFYYVTALNGAESRHSTPDEGYAKPLIPVIPAGLTASTGRNDAKIDLNWTSSEGAATYKIYRADTADGNYNLLASGLTDSFYTDEHPAISVGKTYYYQATAVNVSGESAFSSHTSGSTILPVPEGFSLTKNGQSVTAAWTAVKGATSYRIQRKIDVYSTSWKDLGVTDSCTFTDTALKWGVNHHYRIQAINTDIYSTFSDSVTIYIIW